MALPIPGARQLFDGPTTPQEASERSPNQNVMAARELADAKEEFVEAMTKATVSGAVGETIAGPAIDNYYQFPIPSVIHARSRTSEVERAMGDVEMAKSAGAGAPEGFYGANSTVLAKEWTMTNPVSTGLVPYDLEAPAKLLTPRPTPIRNSTPRLRGQGGARRFKVISGFTGTGTGGQTTTQPGINETSGNSGPGGLSYIRGPYINYAGYDVTLNYVTTSLSDSVSWQAEYQGQGFEDIRSLSNTALLYATMLLDERLMIYGRGTTGNGYAGALGTPTISSVTGVAGSVAPGNPAGFSGSVWVIVAADAGDLLGTTGVAMHQGPATTINGAASVALTAGQVAQVNIGSDVAGALGYNLYAASVVGGPYVYAGRTGYNVGYITSQPTSGPTVTSGAADQSTSATNYDGLLTNVGASGGYVARLNAAFSTTNPGVEFQSAFGNLYEAVKGDPEVVWMNGFDRLQLSNAILNSSNVNAYRVFINNDSMGNVKAGTVVQSLMNEVTGTEIPITVHPWFPQGNALIQQKTLPIPDSNVSETSVMVLPQDYVAVQWPVVQFTYDASTFEIGTFCHYAPAWNGLVSGIQGVGIGSKPPSFGDS
jgi:hypothetical protein